MEISKVWFLAGSRRLYGEKYPKGVDGYPQEIAKSIDGAAGIPVGIAYQSVVKSVEKIFDPLHEAHAAGNGMGITTWMHIFSPARIWTRRLTILRNHCCIRVLHLTSISSKLQTSGISPA